MYSSCISTIEGCKPVVMLLFNGSTSFSFIRILGLALDNSFHLSLGKTVFKPSFPPLICTMTKTLPQLIAAFANVCKLLLSS